MIWRNHQPNIHQSMQSCEYKLPYILKEVIFTESCINLGHTKKKPKLGLSILKLLPHSSLLPINIIHYLVSKLLRTLPNSVIMKSTQYLSPIKLLYPVWNHIIHQSLFPIPNTFNSRKNTTCGGMPVKEYILSVSPHVLITSDSCMILLGGSQIIQKSENISWVRTLNK